MGERMRRLCSFLARARNEPKNAGVMFISCYTARNEPKKRVGAYDPENPASLLAFKARRGI